MTGCWRNYKAVWICMPTQGKYNVVLANCWRHKPIRMIIKGGVAMKSGGRKFL